MDADQLKTLDAYVASGGTAHDGYLDRDLSGAWQEIETLQFQMLQLIEKVDFLWTLKLKAETPTTPK